MTVERKGRQPWFDRLTTNLFCFGRSSKKRFVLSVSKPALSDAAGGVEWGRLTRRPTGYVRRMTTSTRSTTAPSGGSGRLDRVMSSSRTSFR